MSTVIDKDTLEKHDKLFGISAQMLASVLLSLPPTLKRPALERLLAYLVKVKAIDREHLYETTRQWVLEDIDVNIRCDMCVQKFLRGCYRVARIKKKKLAVKRP